VRLICANTDGGCESESDTYQVFIGESDIKCPNAFSPGASEGVNDEWRVSYKSIIRFECHIFNRWGQELYSFRDPAGGWDGKVRGKVVPAGVYFYVITAEGADGRKYRLRGDINVVSSSRRSSGDTQSPAN
ncbi:MAG: gliding motility-associated C-terminal domain-containing protein, partial [Muribaculaceae bacterium]|nr:gliding motility-associated C-terminal domain-containing protein [Muribaculaceae bacterium]